MPPVWQQQAPVEWMKTGKVVKLAPGSALEKGQQRLHLFLMDQSATVTGVMICIPVHDVLNLCKGMTSYECVFVCVCVRIGQSLKMIEVR